MDGVTIMNNYCHVANQIAIHANEPEAKECPLCYSSMTEHLTGLLECDKCEHTEFKDDNDE